MKIHFKGLNALRLYAAISVVIQHIMYSPHDWFGVPTLPDSVGRLFMNGTDAVHLFFVLSGFLVSGLLFKEYIKFGNVRPVHFLIRRGFKIYPVFWLALILFLCIKQYEGSPVSWFRFISEILFLQNYVNGWGYAINGVSWSLAIEEHFYFGLALIFPYVISKNWLRVKNNIQSKKPESIIIAIMKLNLLSTNTIIGPTNQKH